MNPLWGRWISADPLAVHAPGEADLNLYAYVSGAVLKNVDPLGLDTVMITDSVSEKFARQWEKSVHGKLADGRVIRTELEEGRRHVVEVADKASAEDMKGAVKSAAEKAGESGKVIFSVGHGASEDGAASVDLLPSQTNEDHPYRLNNSELRAARQDGKVIDGVKHTNMGNEKTDLLRAYGEALRAEGVETLELLTCRVGRDNSGFVEDIADHTGLRVEAHKHKVGFSENDEGEATSYHAQPGTKQPIPGDESSEMTPAVERVEKPSDASTETAKTDDGSD